MSHTAYQWMQADHQAGTSVFRFTTRALVDQRVIQAIGEELCRAAAPGARIVLDFGHVVQFSSTMLAQLLALRNRVNQSGGRVVIRGMRPELRDLFRVTQTERLFTFEQEDETLDVP